MTNLLADSNQLMTELLKTVEGEDLLLRLTQGGGRGKCLSDGLAFDFEGYPVIWSVPGIVGFGAVTGGLAAFAGSGGQRASAEVAYVCQLVEQFCSSCFEIGQGICHRRSPRS